MPQRKENLKFVIVGHVDHGKSTLIGRLFYDTNSLPEGKYQEVKETCKALGKDIEFGYVMDNLKEERDQGITIDTAQTFFETNKRKYTIIDTPGHVEFIKNMITGASHAEAAILIDDVEEGVQEQTRRHAYILSMLGIDQVTVVINKMDLVDYSQERYREVKKNLLEFLDSIEIKPNQVIPISAKEGDFVAKKTDNLNWFNGPTVLEALDSFQKPPSAKNQDFRLPIQDVYKFNENRIAAGRIESGTLEKGMDVKVLPSGEQTSVKEIKKFDENPVKSIAGESIGLMTEDKLFLDRGNVVAGNDSKPRVTDEFEAHLFWLSKKPFDESERTVFKCATEEQKCDVHVKEVIDSSTLELISEDTDKIENRQIANVTIKTSKPVVVEDFNKTPELGRFVLQRKDTVAGGIITGVKQ